MDFPSSDFGMAWTGQSFGAVAICSGLEQSALRGERKGRVFGDRYHEEPLTNPRQVRTTIIYVLNNARRHGEHREVLPHMQHSWMDPCSSAISFDGWH